MAEYHGENTHNSKITCLYKSKPWKKQLFCVFFHFQYPKSTSKDIKLFPLRCLFLLYINIPLPEKLHTHCFNPISLNPFTSVAQSFSTAMKLTTLFHTSSTLSFIRSFTKLLKPAHLFFHIIHLRLCLLCLLYPLSLINILYFTCGQTPSTASTTMMQPSQSRTAVDTSEEKSTCPGESIKLIRYSWSPRIKQ